MTLSRNTLRFDSKSYLTMAIDGIEGDDLQGRIYYNHGRSMKFFINIVQMIEIIENILNTNNYPAKTTDQRIFDGVSISYIKKTENQGLTQENTFKAEKGKLATGQLLVKHRYYASWQGEINWLEEDRREVFGSYLQLLKIIDNQLGYNLILPIEHCGKEVFRVTIDEHTNNSAVGGMVRLSADAEYTFSSMLELMRLMYYGLDALRKCGKAEAVDCSQVIPEHTLNTYRTRGSQTTFIIRILFEENLTWQGIISWKKTGQSISFRSFLEMIKLIDTSLSGYTLWDTEENRTLQEI